MDWSKSPDVERRPGFVSGAWVVKGTRVQADAVIDNAAAGLTPEQIARDIFPTVPVDRARRVIEFARQHETGPARRERPPSAQTPSSAA